MTSYVNQNYAHSGLSTPEARQFVENLLNPLRFSSVSVDNSVESVEISPLSPIIYENYVNWAMGIYGVIGINWSLTF